MKNVASCSKALELSGELSAVSCWLTRGEVAASIFCSVLHVGIMTWAARMGRKQDTKKCMCVCEFKGEAQIWGRGTRMRLKCKFSSVLLLWYQKLNSQCKGSYALERCAVVTEFWWNMVSTLLAYSRLWQEMLQNTDRTLFKYSLLLILICHLALGITEWLRLERASGVQV